MMPKGLIRAEKIFLALLAVNALAVVVLNSPDLARTHRVSLELVATGLLVPCLGFAAAGVMLRYPTIGLSLATAFYLLLAVTYLGPDSMWHVASGVRASFSITLGEIFIIVNVLALVLLLASVFLLVHRASLTARASDPNVAPNVRASRLARIGARLLLSLPVLPLAGIPLALLFFLPLGPLNFVLAAGMLAKTAPFLTHVAMPIVGLLALFLFGSLVTPFNMRFGAICLIGAGILAFPFSLNDHDPGFSNMCRAFAVGLAGYGALLLLVMSTFAVDDKGTQVSD